MKDAVACPALASENHHGWECEGFLSYRFAIWLALGMASCGLPVLSQDYPGQAAPPLDQHANTTESEAALIALSKAQPTNPEPLARLGLLEARQEHYPQAITFYRKAVALQPSMPGLRLNLGLALFKDGQYKQALQIFTPMLKSQPSSSPEAQRLSILIGMSHYGLGEYEAAVPYLKQASDSDAQNLPLLLTLAHSCLLSKQYQCVLDAYHRMVEQNAESAEADMLVGEALDEMKDTIGATREFRAAVQANPKEPNAHFGLGYLLWTQMQYQEAIQEFQAELDNTPGYALPCGCRGSNKPDGRGKAVIGKTGERRSIHFHGTPRPGYRLCRSWPQRGCPARAQCGCSTQAQRCECPHATGDALPLHG
jgi:tetratricopeptide (TPR) repeat protein